MAGRNPFEEQADWLQTMRYSVPNQPVHGRVAPDEEVRQLKEDALSLRLGQSGTSPDLQQLRARADYLLNPNFGARGGMPQQEPVLDTHVISQRGAGTLVPNADSNFTNELSAGMAGFTGSMQDLRAAITDSPDAKAAASLAQRESGYYAGQSTAPTTFSEVGSPGEFAAWVRRGAASTLPQYIPAAGATAASLALPGGPVALGVRMAGMGMTGAGAIATQQGQTAEAVTGERQYDKGDILQGAVLYSAAEAASPGIGRALGMNKGLGVGSLTTGKALGVTFAGGAAVETAQTMLENKYGRMSMDPDARMFDETARSNYVDAAILGGVLDTAVGAPGYVKDRMRATPNSNPVVQGQSTDILAPQAPVVQTQQSDITAAPVEPGVAQESFLQPYGADQGPVANPTVQPQDAVNYGDTSRNISIFDAPEFRQKPQVQAPVSDTIITNPAVQPQPAQQPIALPNPIPAQNPAAAADIATQRYDAATAAWKSGTATEADIQILDLGRPGGVAPVANPNAQIATPVVQKQQGFLEPLRNPSAGPMNTIGETVQPDNFALTGQAGGPNPMQGELALGTPDTSVPQVATPVSAKQGSLFTPGGKPTKEAYVAPTTTEEVKAVIDQRQKDHGFKGEAARNLMLAAVESGMPDESNDVTSQHDIGEMLGQMKYKQAEAKIADYIKVSKTKGETNGTQTVETVQAETQKPQAPAGTNKPAVVTPPVAKKAIVAKTVAPKVEAAPAKVEVKKDPVVDDKPATRTVKVNTDTVKGLMQQIETMVDEGTISESDGFLISEKLAEHDGLPTKDKIVKAKRDLQTAGLKKMVEDAAAETDREKAKVKAKKESDAAAAAKADMVAAQKDDTLAAKQTGATAKLDDLAVAVRAEEIVNRFGEGKDNLLDPEKRILRAALQSALTRNDVDSLRRILEAKQNARVVAPYLASRATAPAGQVTAAQIRSHALVREMAGKVKVVDSAADVPLEIGPRDEAVYDARTGMVWIVADNVSRLSDVPKIVLHEVVGHKGVLEVLTDTQLKGLMSDVMHLAARSKEVAAAWATVKREYADDLKALRDKGDNKMANTLHILETVARLAETGKYNNLITKLVHFLRQTLRNMGFPGNWVNKQYVGDLYAMFRDVDKVIRSGKDTPPPSSTRMAFARKGELNPMAKQAVTRLGEVSNAVATDSMGWLHRHALNNMKSLQYMVSQYADQLPSLRKVYELGDRIESTGHKIRQQYEPAVTAFIELSDADSKAVADLIWSGDKNMYRLDKANDTHLWSEERLAQYNADKAKFDQLPDDAKSAYTKALDTPKELRERASKLLRQLQDGVGSKAIALQQEQVLKAQEKVDRLKDQPGEALDMAKLQLRSAKIALSRAESTHKTMTARLDSLFQSDLEGYFPHRRFGDWVVSYKSEAMQNAESDLNDAYEALAGAETDGELKAAKAALDNAEMDVDRMKSEPKNFIVEAFDSQAEADKRAKELGGKSFLASQTYSEADGVSRKFIADMQDAATMTFGEGVGGEVSRMLNEQYLRSLSNKSIFKSSMRRADVSGFSKDVPRIIADEIVKYSGQLPKMEFGADLRDAISAVQTEGKSGVTQAASVIAEQVRKNYEQDQKAPQGTVDSAIAKHIHAWYLAMSPAYLAMQTLQGPMISAPMISAKHGVGATTKAMATAAAEIGKAMKIQLTDEFAQHGRKGVLHTDFDFSNMTGKDSADVKELVNYMREHNVLSITQDVELTELAKGRGTESKWDTVLKTAVMPGHLVEVWNRAYTGLASYRLELARNGGDKAAAMAYATDVVAQTHGNYAKHNKPYALKPGLFPMQRTLMMFRSYQHMMVEMLVRNFKESKFMQDAPADLTAEEKTAWYERRSIARRTFFGVMASHGVMAGTLGIPGVATAATIAGLMGMDDDDESLETKYRKFLADMTNPVVGEMLAKGILRAPGIAQLTGDISARIGLQDIFNPLRTFDSGKEGRDRAAQFATAALGPAYGVVANVMEAQKAYNHGQYDKILPNMLPKAVADLVKGTQMIGDDKRSALDVANQMLGVRPVSVSREQEAKAAVSEAKGAYSAKNDYFSNRLAVAKTGEDRAKIMREFTEYKKDHPQYKTTYSSLAKSAVRKKSGAKLNASLKDEFADFVPE